MSPHPGRSEHLEQSAFFNYIKLIANYPENKYLFLAFAVPNWRPKKSQRMYLGAEGVKAGVPDVWLALPRGRYHGLVIEMKVKPNKPTKHQIKWIKQLNEVGYLAVVCYGFEEAREILDNYLALGEFTNEPQRNE